MRYLLSQNRLRRISLCKFIHALLTTHALQQKYYYTDPLCPLCTSQPETLYHVLTCPSTSALSNRNEQFHHMPSNLEKIRTPHMLQALITQGVSWYISTSDHPHEPSMAPDLPCDMQATQCFS